MKQYLSTLATLLITLLLSACQSPPTNQLVIGTMSGPEAELVQVAALVAAEQYGLNIKIVQFNDYNLPNQALNEGSLDANVYQHIPYLEAANAAHGYHLVAVGKTFLYPVALYSKRFHAVSELPEQALIALPNDPSNQTRALKLLQQAQLITLNNAQLPTVHDIIANPHHLRFKELDAAQLPHALADVDAAVINTTFALPAGLNPAREALIIEHTPSPYTNVIVSQPDANHADKIQQFVQSFHSPRVKLRAAELFQGAAIPAW